MSKGSPIIRFRMPKHMVADVQAIIDGSLHRFAGKWTWTSWMLAAAQMKLDHVKRSRNRKCK